MGIMIIELVASRIISKYFGNSLYTWTGIIGIVLGGITLGNFLGGKFADRYPVKKAAPVLLISASALTILLLVLDLIIDAAMTGLTFSNPALMLIAAIAVISLLFFLPSTALGTISPVMAKYALERSAKVGSTVGNIYASGAAGSIIGTFLSGFVLVPLLGIRTVVFVVAAVIALLSLLVNPPKRLFAGWLVLLSLLFFLFTLAKPGGVLASASSGGSVFRTDSMYSHIEVQDREDDRRVLVMDGLIHNMYDRSDPDILLYEYERIFRLLTDRIIEERAESGGIRTLTLGGGALTFPSYLERHYPESEHHVVEIDPEVVRIAHEYFDIPKDSALNIHVLDARQFVGNADINDKFDIIYLDVFNSYSIPYHLTTAEFSERLASLLTDDGMLLVNLIDVFSIGRFLGAYAVTIETVFPHYKVFVDENFSREDRSTFVLAASETPISVRELEYESGERFLPIDVGEIEDLIKRTNSRPLTDNHAPVENLIAPVFLEAVSSD
jgi:spermidine synthase